MLDGTNTAPLRVFLVDDSPVLRERLKRLIEAVPATRLVGVADEALGMLTAIGPSAADVLVLDTDRLGENLSAILASVKAEHPSLRVMVLANESTTQYAEMARRVGANAFLDRNHHLPRIGGILSGWRRDLALTRGPSYEFIDGTEKDAS